MELGSGGNAPILAAGLRIDRYELVAPIHRSASASVWVARQRSVGGLERLVAMRIFHAPLADDARFREAVLQEVKLASAVAHPNVAQITDFGEREDLIWIVSEWIDGHSLATLQEALDRKKLKIPPAILLRILADACAGLHAAHLLRDRAGHLLNVVHGDVSLRSIVIATNGVTRIVELGVGKATARLAGAANHSWRQLDGTQPPPGQRIDRHADVWSIGATLAESLAHVVAGGGSPDGTGPNVPSTVIELVTRAMSADPVERFATAAEMQGAIEAAMVTLGIATTSANVAAFAAEHLADRAAERSEAIDLALTILGPIGSVAPPATIDSISAIAHTVHPSSGSASGSPNALALATPNAGMRPATSTAMERAAITGEAIPRAMIPTDARFSASPPAMDLAFGPGPPAARRTRAKIAGAAVVTTLALTATGVLSLRSARPQGQAAGAQLAIAAPAPPPKPTCPKGMVEIPGGKFYMGSDDDLDLEKPAHHVVLAPYCIDVFEVTTESYKSCSDGGDCKRAAQENKWPGITGKDQKTYDPLCNVREPMARGRHPINCVDFDMASVYCAAHGGRLPTEAEWEFAARGPDGRKYPWGDDEPGPLELNACGKECLAWGKKNHVELEAMFDGDDGWPTTAPVGSFPNGKSRYGVQDVVGNVWEWTGDYYAGYTAEQQDNPRGPKTGTERVIRGGAWNGAYPSWVRPTFRYHNDPATRSYGVGFRCARTL